MNTMIYRKKKLLISNRELEQWMVTPMPDLQFFPQRPETHPMIYAYSDIAYPGCLKVGFTAVDVDKRV